MSEPIMNNSMNNSTNNSTANAAYRAFFGLSKQASFIATLAASSIAFAQAPAAAPAATPASGNAQVKPTAGQAAAETFTIQFQDTDILQALQMLSMQGRRNIIASRGVQGKVSANLYDVGLFDALDVIMRANDLRMEESGNFIYVYTRQEWEDVTKSRLKKVSRNFPLEYLNAKDAGEFIGPILSEVGKVSFVGDVEKGFQPSATDGGSDSWAFQGMLVVSDYPENIKAIEALLKEIDTPPAQVIVESTVVSTDVQQNDGFGVDVSIIGNLSFSQFTNPLSGAQQLLNGSVQKGEGVANASNTNVTNIKDPTLQVGVISDDVSVFLKLLDSVTDTTVLARPRVMALNRQRAQILIGQRTGYLNSTTTQTSTTQSVEFLDSGIKLIFRPFISSDGSIRMELAPSVSEATKSSTATVGGNTMEVPNESTSEIVTNVRVKNGQTLVLGGLFKEKTVIDRRQVPGLGDVPLIGNAFKGYNDDLHREEIIFLVTPTIVKDEIAKVWSDEAREFEHAVRIGAREGLLPWSRDTLTTAQNQKAFEAMGKGDRDLALFHCENSLRLSHNQPEMVRFREDLVGQGSTAQSDFERSMLRRMIQKQMDGAKQVTAESTATDAMDSAATDNAAGSANSGMDLGAKK
ncbi:MAG: putative type pilus biosis protein PilQ [Planctomycetota bacterium]